MAEGRWGVELWDRAEQALHHVTADLASLTQHYGRFYKELGEAEREYARALRRLCGKYGGAREEGGEREETSRERGEN